MRVVIALASLVLSATIYTYRDCLSYQLRASCAVLGLICTNEVSDAFARKAGKLGGTAVGKIVLVVA